jgi:TPR repeat protein
MENYMLKTSFDSLSEDLKKGLFLLYRNGSDINSRTQAFQIFLKEASRNDKQACWLVAGCLSCGIGVKNDWKKLKIYSEKASPLPEGYYLLGFFFDFFRDFSKAFSYFSQALQARLVESQFKIADYYYNGKGVPVDIKKAKEMFQELAYYGDGFQTYRFALTLKYGRYSFQKNLTLSHEYLLTYRNQPKSFFSYFC